MKKLVGVMLLVFMLLLGAYADSAPSPWAEDEYNAAKALGLVIPEVDSDFQGSITRREFCILIVNMVEVEKGAPVEITIENPFLDINEDDVTKAYQLGIVKGVSETKFAPDRLISRQEIAVMMMRAARKLDEMNGTSYTSDIDIARLSFVDEADIADWAIGHVKNLYKLGLMKGVGKDKIGPLRPTKREEGILLTYRLYKGYTEGVASANVAPVAASDPVEFGARETVELVIGASDLATDESGGILEIKKIGETDLKMGTPLALDYGKIVLEDGSLKYTSNDLDETKVETFVVTVSDSIEEVEVNVEITISFDSSMVAKEKVEFDTREDTAINLGLADLVTGIADRTVINGVKHQFSSEEYGTFIIGEDKKSFGFTPNDVTKNESEIILVEVQDGDLILEVPVKINISEVGNIPPALANPDSTGVGNIIIPPGQYKTEVPLSEFFTDGDGDVVTILSIYEGDEPTITLTNEEILVFMPGIDLFLPADGLVAEIPEAYPGLFPEYEIFVLTFTDGTDIVSVIVDVAKEW